MLLLPLAATATAQIPPRSISAPKEEVDDEFLAYLHGLLYTDAELYIDGEALPREFPEFVPSRPTPFNDITLFTRTRAQRSPNNTHPSRITLEFSVPLRYEVPVDILGHHPVELQGSSAIVFQEVLRPTESSGAPGGVAAELKATFGVEVPDEVDQFLLLTLWSGYLRVDFAQWLDFVSGRLLEDVDVTLIAVARYRDRWFAMLGGYSPAGRPMTGVLDMRTSRFLVSPPRLLTRLARDLVVGTTRR